MPRTGWFLLAICALGLGAGAAVVQDIFKTEADQVVELAPGVYFRHGRIDAPHGHCNNGFIVLDDFVLAIDANFPDGAKKCLDSIAKVTEKPVRFVFDTHHHGDHAYGNAVWRTRGALPIAHENVVTEMRRYEPKRWRETNRDDVRALGDEGPMPPVITYPDRLVVDDGKRRVELLHFGTAHTRGDGFAYLPKEKILFTGDAVVNGPFNYMGDGDTESWLRVLDALAKLDVKIVAPGHGACADESLIALQREYIATLRGAVRKGIEKNATLESLQASIEVPEHLDRYRGRMFKDQIAKIYGEMTE